jgi:hypothetical protein
LCSRNTGLCDEHKIVTMKKFKTLLIIAATAAFIYFVFIKNKVAIVASTTGTTTVTDPLNILRTPPPGYQGPINGPFTWAGIGEPPDGKYTVLGNPIT